jgi:hypothetical protein
MLAIEAMRMNVGSWVPMPLLPSRAHSVWLQDVNLQPLDPHHRLGNGLPPRIPHRVLALFASYQPEEG